ncbi:MAG: hypothetical protein KC994_13130 [Candidatus Omnitrophica bacterium]|nr:hypothetical protein [Candidatus Omnitrophota bacterium]
MTVLDWVVFIAYLVVTAAIGFWCGRNQKSVEDYFLGSREVPWWAAMLSLVATETSAVTVVAIPAQIYAPGGDMGFLHCAVGFAIGKILISIFILPAYFQHQITTPYEYLGSHLGRGGQVAGSVLFATALYIGAAFRIYVGAIPLKVATGLDLTVCLLIISVLAMAYTLLGGLRAVIWTDVFQMLLFISGGAVALIFILNTLPDGLTSLIESMKGSGRIGPFDQPYLLDMGFRESAGGGSAYDWTQPHTFFAGFLGAAILTLATHGTDHSNIQRLLACVSLGKARLALVVSAFVVFFQFALFLLVGAAVAAFYDQTGTHPELETGNSILPYFITHELPAGLSGLLIAGIFAAAMSTVDSALSALSATTVTDLSGKKKVSSNPLKQARNWVVIWGVLLWLGSQGAAMVGKQDLIGSIFTASTTIYGPLLGVFLIALVMFRNVEGGKRGWIIWPSLAIGVLVQSGVFLLGQTWAMGENTFSIAWPWVTPIGAAATFLPAAILAKWFGTRQD